MTQRLRGRTCLGVHMRSRKALTRGCVSLASSLVVSLFVALSTTTSATAETPTSLTLLDDYVDLPLSDVTTTLVDADHHQIFVAGAAKDADLLAVSSAGDLVARIPLAGVKQMALDEDASHVYAAIPTAHEIAVIDTSTYELTVHDVGDSCPQSVAAFDGGVWFASGCGGAAFEHLQVLDLASGAVGAPLDYADYGVALNRVSGTDELLVSGGNSTGLIDTGTAALMASSGAVSVRTNDVEFSPDHTSVFVYHSGITVSLPDLTPQQPPTTYDGLPPDGGNQDLAFTDEGDVRVFDRASAAAISEIRLIDFSGATLQERRTALVDGILDVFTYYVVNGTNTARMYLDRDPSAPGPVITAPFVEGTATHQATLHGTFADANGPLSAAVLTVRDDEGVALGTTTTAADGTWTFVHTWPDSGSHRVSIQSEPTATRKAALVYTYADIARRQVDMTVDGPDTAEPHQTVHLTGTMTIEGSPAPSADIGWSLRCFDGEGVGTPSQGSLTTDDSGDYQFDVDPGRCADLDVEVFHDADASTVGFDLDHRVAVSWPLYRVQLPDLQTVYAGTHLDAAVTVTLNGQPAADVPVHLTIDPYPHAPQIEQTEITDDQGSVPLSVDVNWAGPLFIDARVDGTPVVLGDETYQNLDVPEMPSTLTVHTDVDHTTVGETVTASGTLSHPQGDSTNDGQVRLLAKDLASDQVRVQWAYVGPNGTYAFQDVPLAGGTTEYHVDYPGTNTVAPADPVSTSVTVAKLASAPTLTTDHPIYRPDTIAHLHVDLGYNAPFTLTGTVHGVSNIIEKGYADANGADIDVPMTYTETFQVATDGDLAHAAGSSPATTTPVEMLLHPDPTAHARPKIFAAWMHPWLRATEQPARKGTCLRFELQRRTTSGWVRLERRRCLTADAHGVVSYHFTRPHRVGVLYRFWASFAGDDRNLAAHTPHIRFQFRRS